MPPSPPKSNDLLLGQLIAEVKALNERLDRNDRHMEEHRERDRQDRRELEEDVSQLKQYMTEVEGGKKMLFGLMAVAASLGGFVWEVLSRFVFK